MGVQATALADPGTSFPAATPPQGPVDQPTQALHGVGVTPPQGYNPVGQPVNGNMVPSGAAPLFQPNTSDPTVVPFQQQQQPQHESQKGLMFAAGIGILALLGGLAFILLGLSGDDSGDLLDDRSDSIATEDSTGTTLPLQSTTSTSFELETTAFSETTETASTDAGDSTVSTVDPASTSLVENPTSTVTSSTTTTTAPSTTTTAPSSSTAAPTSAVAVDQEKVAAFRAGLQAQNIGTDNLTNDQIQRFANRICEVASVSNADAFESFRAEQISSRPDQDPVALRSTIDAATITFCPAEANRLGIA